MVFNPSPRSQWSMISQGAEARVWKLLLSSPGSITSADVAVCKERFPKKYRHPDLDKRLTKSRCRSEAKILERCAEKSNIRVPKVIRIDPPRLYLEFLNGPSVKSYLHHHYLRRRQQQQHIVCNQSADRDNRNTAEHMEQKLTIRDIVDLARQMGQLVGRLHNIGIVHGDLTTSNMMILEVNNDNASCIENDKKETEEHCTDASSSFELALIDFGLSKSSLSVEEQAVDLYVLERALQSTHPDLPGNFFARVLEKYSSTTTMKSADCNDNSGAKKRKSFQTTLQRLEQVRTRGRKRECFG